MSPARPEANGRPVPSSRGIQDDEMLWRAIGLVRALRDPALPGLVFLVCVLISGGVVLALTVFNVANTPFVPLQTPFLVSGGFGGVALLAVGALLAAVQAERRDRVTAEAQMQELIDELGALVHSATTRTRRRRQG